MPMPINLPEIKWKHVWEGGKNFEEWLEDGENEQNVEAIKMMLKDQTFTPDSEEFVTSLDRTVHIVAIAEDWCPDVIRHVPVLQKMAELSTNIQIRFIKRIDHPDVFTRFLTVGGEAIPKFIFLSADFVECANWGPMPRECREFIARGKAYGDNGKARELVFASYFADPERKVVAAELIHELGIASSQRPS